MTSLNMVAIATTCCPISLLCKSMNYPYLMTFSSFCTLFLDLFSNVSHWLCLNSQQLRQFLVEYYFKSYRYGRNNGPSLKWTSQQFSLAFDKKPPVKSCLLDIIRKFRDTGSVDNDNKCNSGRKRTIRTNENHGIILEKVLRSPKKSRRRLSKELGISRSSVNRMIKDIGAFSYKIQILQSLQPQDPHQRFNYATCFLAQNYADEDFVENIWFSDECHVLLSGHVNKQNMRFLYLKGAFPDALALWGLH